LLPERTPLWGLALGRSCILVWEHFGTVKSNKKERKFIICFFVDAVVGFIVVVDIVVVCFYFFK